MAKNFPNLKKEIDIQVQEAQRVPNKRNPNRPTPRHIITKMAKVTDIQKQKVSYKGIPIRLSAEFSAETLHASRERNNIFKLLKGKTYNLEYSTQQGYHS